MFRELGRIDIYDNILDDYDITDNPGDYDESETKLQMEIMKDDEIINDMIHINISEVNYIAEE